MEHFPTQFRDADLRTQKKIIDLGLFSWQVLQAELDSIQDTQNVDVLALCKDRAEKEAKQWIERETSRLAKLHKAEVEDHQTEQETLKRRLLAVKAESAEQLKDLEGQLLKRFDKDLETQKTQIAREVRLSMAEEVSALKSELQMLKVKEEFKSAYEFAKSQYEGEKKRADELELKLQELTRVRSSYHLGKEGESEIEDLLRGIPEFDFLNVNTEADKADFRLTNKEGQVIILDSKKFKGAVPKKDRDKLIANTDKDALICAGLMVSLNSKVSARTHCEIEYSPCNKPILYLCLQDMSNDAKLQTLDTALKLVLRLIATQDEKEKEKLVEKIHMAFGKLEELSKKTENIKKNATDILENTKLCLTDIKCLKDVLSIH